jgi:hypothetical protein
LTLNCSGVIYSIKAKSKSTYYLSVLKSGTTKGLVKSITHEPKATHFLAVHNKQL